MQDQYLAECDHTCCSDVNSATGRDDVINTNVASSSTGCLHSPLTVTTEQLFIVTVVLIIDDLSSVLTLSLMMHNPESQQVTTNKNISDTRQLTLALQDAFSVAHRKNFFSIKFHTLQ